MATPAEVRLERIANDYKEMLNIQGGLVSWRSLNGVAPHIDKYELTIRVRSIVSSSPAYRDQHRVVVDLPAGYPNSAPNAKMIDAPIVFHPNWWPDGRWCCGAWDRSEFLGHFVLRLVKTLQYDREITNERSPANREANDWYIGRKDTTNLFPCDRQHLPDPTKKLHFVPKSAASSISTFEPRANQSPIQDGPQSGFSPRR